MTDFEKLSINIEEKSLTTDELWDLTRHYLAASLADSGIESAAAALAERSMLGFTSFSVSQDAPTEPVRVRLTFDLAPAQDGDD